MTERTPPAASEPLRVAIVGYGLAGSIFHAPFIATTPGLRVAGVVTRDPARRAEAERAHPGVEMLGTPDDLWAAAERFDLAVIATPNRTHAPLAHAALGAGLPVVVDKPFAVTADEAAAVASDGRRRGLLVSVYQNRRWDADFQTLRRLFAAGVLGTPLRFESRFERWRPVPKAGWRESGSPEDAGGILYDLGSHLVDQALVLLGPATHVYAELDRRRPGVEVDDDAFVAITHASGARSHLWASAMAGAPGPRFRFLGSKGAYRHEALDPQEAALKDGVAPGSPGWGVVPEAELGELVAGDERRAVPAERGDYGAFYRGIERSLREGAPLPVEPADAAAALRVLEAARESAASARVVPIAR